MPLIPVGESKRTMMALVRERAPLPPAGDFLPPASQEKGPGSGGRSLEDVLIGRRSVYEFAPEPLEYSRLRQIIDLAQATQRRQWPQSRHGDPGLQILMAAQRVNGLTSGLHAREPDGTARLLGRPDWMGELFESYADAPVLVLICGALRDTPEQAYGGLMVRAGALGYAVWLAARTHGVECSVYGGASYRINRTTTAGHLFTVAVGHPAGLG